MTISTIAATTEPRSPGGYAAGINGADALALSHAPLGDFSQISNQPAFTFRLSYQPSFIPGFAGSSAVYYSPNITPRGAYSDELLDDGTNRPLGNNAMTIFDTEARYRVPNTGLELRAEYAYVNFSNPENLRANNDSIDREQCRQGHVGLLRRDRLSCPARKHSGQRLGGRAVLSLHPSEPADRWHLRDRSERIERERRHDVP